MLIAHVRSCTCCMFFRGLFPLLIENCSFIQGCEWNECSEVLIIIIILMEWFWTPVKLFVLIVWCFCSLFCAWPCTKHKRSWHVCVRAIFYPGKTWRLRNSTKVVKCETKDCVRSRGPSNINLGICGPFKFTALQNYFPLSTTRDPFRPCVCLYVRNVKKRIISKGTYCRKNIASYVILKELCHAMLGNFGTDHLVI